MRKELTSPYFNRQLLFQSQNVSRQRRNSEEKRLEVKNLEGGAYGMVEEEVLLEPLRR